MSDQIKGMLTIDPNSPVCVRSTIPLSSSAALSIVGEKRQALLIYNFGPILLEGFDKEGRSILKVDRKGNVLSGEKEDVSEITKFFWDEFARYFRSKMGYGEDGNKH